MFKEHSLVDSKFYDQLKTIMEVKELKLNLLYRATRGGLKSQDFHS
jgi:hypothetical protein